jgi:hypothetical protein
MTGKEVEYILNRLKATLTEVLTGLPRAPDLPEPVEGTITHTQTRGDTTDAYMHFNQWDRNVAEWFSYPSHSGIRVGDTVLIRPAQILSIRPQPAPEPERPPAPAELWMLWNPTNNTWTKSNGKYECFLSEPKAQERVADLMQSIRLETIPVRVIAPREEGRDG